MNNFEHKIPKVEEKEELPSEEKKLSDQVIDDETDQANLQNEIVADRKLADSEIMKLRQDLQEAPEGKTEDKAEATSARISKYVDQGFDILINDLEDQLTGFKGLFNPKGEIKEAIDILKQKKDSYSQKSVVPSWESVMTMARNFNRKNKVNVAIEAIKNVILKEGDLDNYQDGLKNVEKQIKPSEVKLSGE